ncbi:hypothetical protein GCM10027451_46330 [Geodermatophilus aquaeductus]
MYQVRVGVPESDPPPPQAARVDATTNAVAAPPRARRDRLRRVRRGRPPVPAGGPSVAMDKTYRLRFGRAPTITAIRTVAHLTDLRNPGVSRP